MTQLIFLSLLYQASETMVTFERKGITVMLPAPVTFERKGITVMLPAPTELIIFAILYQLLVHGLPVAVGVWMLRKAIVRSNRVASLESRVERVGRELEREREAGA